MRSANVAVFAILTALASWSGVLKPATGELAGAAGSVAVVPQVAQPKVVRVAHTVPAAESRIGVAD